MNKEIFSIPNILSCLRIFLIPAFVFLFVNSGNGVGYHIGAVSVLVVSGLTDLLDGMIARKFGMVTDLGKIIDPIADYLTQSATVTCLAVRYKLLIPVAALLVIKEIVMAVLGAVSLKKGRTLNGSRWYGKVSTAVFYGVMLILLSVPYRRMPSAVSAVLIAFSGAWILFSFVMYIHEYVILWQDIVI